VILCRNCHRKLTDAQKDHPKTPDVEPLTKEKQIGHFLLGLSDLLKLVAEKLRDFGAYLIQFPRTKPTISGVQQWPT
jgi:hypothetical protein